MADFDYLQPILGTAKKNRVFSVLQHNQTKDYHVYFGLELFEVVPSDRQDTRFKLMIAHLCNVGITLTKLKQTFGIDPRTIKSWSNALRSGNAQILARALAGRDAGRKLTRAVEHYVRTRFPAVYAANPYTYSRQIRGELKEMLDVELSAESLRPLFGQLKAEFNHRNHPSATETTDYSREQDQDDDDDGATTGSPEEQPTPEIGPADHATEQRPQEPGSPTTESREEQPADSEAALPQEGGALQTSTEHLGALHLNTRSVPDNRKGYAQFPEPCWCSHLGLLLFAEPLGALQKALGEQRGLPITQWAAQVLAGAANLEQTKLLSSTDLSLILGEGLLGCPGHQRTKLSEFADDPVLARRILRWNFLQVKGETMSDFYFDPHTKQYTGKQNVLKGWCSKIRWADKVMHGDFVHSTSGQPLYLENDDNYQDMRQRFKQLEIQFRACMDIAEKRKLTWVIDRAIFGSEIFSWILESDNRSLITWEKGYQRGAWPKAQKADIQGSMTVERNRNNSTDKRIYQFEWIEQPWPKNPKLRRILVLATNPDGKQVEVSILTDDKGRPAKEIVWLMFDRWVQENDFKYLDEHFGLNEITSYRSETYAEIKDQLEDREVKNADYAALERAKREQKARMGALLVTNEESKARDVRRIQAIAKLEALGTLDAKERLELGQLKGAQKSAEQHREKRQKQIERSGQQIDELTKKLQETQKLVSRLDTLISKGAVRLCGDRKYLMDVVKITARNVFYAALKPFKDAYDNYRDDHVWYRHLSQSGGFIEASPEDGLLRCHLIGTADLPKPVRRVFEKVLAQFNATAPQLPDGSRRQIELILGSKSAIQLATGNG